MKKLAIALATRGRPDRVVETVARSVPLWTNPNTVLWIMADHDDPATAEAFEKTFGQWPTDRIRLDVRERELTIAAKWNRILKLEPDADVYLNTADDDPYVTPGYDDKVLDAAKRFPDGLGFISGHMANASFPKSQGVTRRMAEKLGYYYPEYFPYWFVDHWIDDIARIIGRYSFAEVDTDQSKPGKTQEMRETGWWATWFDAAYLMRRKIAHDIIRSDDFLSPPWLKEMLLAHHPMIEYHSKWTNNTVRLQSPHLDKWSGLSNTDSRYQAIKQRAVDMVPHLLDDYGMHPVEALQYRNVLSPPQTITNLQQAFA